MFGYEEEVRDLANRWRRWSKIWFVIAMIELFVIGYLAG